MLAGMFVCSCVLTGQVALAQPPPAAPPVPPVPPTPFPLAALPPLPPLPFDLDRFDVGFPYQPQPTPKPDN